MSNLCVLKSLILSPENMIIIIVVFFPIITIKFMIDYKNGVDHPWYLEDGPYVTEHKPMTVVPSTLMNMMMGLFTSMVTALVIGFYAFTVPLLLTFYTMLCIGSGKMLYVDKVSGWFKK